MKKIQYSVAMMRNPMDDQEPAKAYANLQQTGTVDLDELADHITDHNSVFSKGTIVGILTELSVCIRELLLQGYRVNLGSLGSFVPTISSNGASTREKFTADNIKSLTAHFTAGRALKQLLRDAEFEKTSTRRAQAATLAAEIKGETTVDISKPEGDEQP